MGGIVAIPSVDTIKKLDKFKKIIKTEDREIFWLAQTPQMFKYKKLLNALNKFDGIPTDISLASEFMKIISEKCSKNDQYVLPGTAISEAIFRILIAIQNQPMSILDIHSKLANVWSSVIYLKNLSETVVIRVMEGDNQYGFSSE